LPREVRAVDPGSWDRAAIIVALRDWAALVGRAPRAHESSSTASGPGPGAARWLAEHPRWPSAGTVVYHFGAWSDALQAARLPRLTVDHELPRRERVATAVPLRAAGESVRSIAEQLGVHLRTVHRYLAASTCPRCGGPSLYGEHCRQCASAWKPITRSLSRSTLSKWPGVSALAVQGGPDLDLVQPGGVPRQVH
jgi:Homeodomain-like domain